MDLDLNKMVKIQGEMGKFIRQQESKTIGWNNLNFSLSHL